MIFDDVLYRSGSFDQIIEWVMDHQAAMYESAFPKEQTIPSRPIMHMAVMNWHFGPDNCWPKSWDGEMSFRAHVTADTIKTMFTSSKIELLAPVKELRTNPGYLSLFRFIMLEEDWPTLAVMQALSR